MPKDEKTRAASRAGGTESLRQRARASAERPFDMWLQKQLHAMYDEIASEPLPGDLLNLIDHDAASDDGAADGSSSVSVPVGKKT